MIYYKKKFIIIVTLAYVIVSIGLSHGITINLGGKFFNIPSFDISFPSFNNPRPSIFFDKIYIHEDLFNPTDIVYFKGKYVATELYKNRLAIFDNFSFESFEHFDPRSIGKKLHNPHYLAVTKRGTLLITNGWGSSIVEINNVNGDGWKEFYGIDRFNAPHGICVDENGWIYVGDSLNSRLVRFKDLDGNGWQIFPDKNKSIAYIRQLTCKNGEIWAVNSYENRSGLNKGVGSNILKITDFDSGIVEEMASMPHTNATSVFPFSKKVLWAEWQGGKRLMSIEDNDQQPKVEQGSLPILRVPYSFYFDKLTQKLIVSYFGSLSDPDKQKGGFITYRVGD